MIKWLTALKADIGQGQYQGLWHYAEILDVVVKYLEVSEPVQPHQVDCTGCKFVGTYDTDFPCANCLRKTKDYYGGAKMVNDIDYERATEDVQYCERYEPTYNTEDGSL